MKRSKNNILAIFLAMGALVNIITINITMNQ